MSSFSEHLARLADAARGLQDGESLSRGLMKLAGDIDDYIADQMTRPYRDGIDVFQKWYAFMIESLDDTTRYHEAQLRIERRRLARAVAADPRWCGGYGDALALLEGKEKEGE